MSKLQEIQDILAQKMGWESWDEMYHANPSGLPIEEVALLFAQAVAEDALKRAAESLDREIIEGVIYVDKQSILSTPINTDL